MEQNEFTEVTPGVLKINSNRPGPDDVTYKGTKYYRFMDYFYTQDENLDEMTLDQVSNLCRARAMYPGLISSVNVKVRAVFKELANAMRPASLLEIGAGKNPVYEVNDSKPNRYILADADFEVVDYHCNLKSECYEFSREICRLPAFDNFFELVIAVFVLHFPFHQSQLTELYRRLSVSGVVVVNIYRRSAKSRECLTSEMVNTGFKVKKIHDANNLCREHEYWILGKQDADLEKCALVLQRIILS